MGKTRQVLEKTIVQGKDYKDVYDSCVRFLDRTKVMIDTIKDPKPTLEAKKVTLEKFQVELQRIFDWQKKLDHFTQKGQLLSSATTNQKVIMELSQVSKKYEVLLASAKSVIRKLETNYQEHHQHASLIKDCTSKISTIQEKLEDLTPVGNSIMAFDKKLEHIQDVQKLVEKCQRKLTYILDLKERVIPNTHVSGILQVENSTAEIKVQIDAVMASFLETKNEVTKNYHQLKDYKNQSDLIHAWMNNVTESLDKKDASINSLAERKIFIENLRAHEKEFEDWASIINKFKESPFVDSEGSSTENSNILASTINEYNQLEETILSTIKKEEGFAQKHEDWLQYNEEAKEWLDESSMRLRSLSSTASQKDDDLKELKDILLPEFLNELKENEVLLESMEDARMSLENGLSDNAQSILSSCNDETRTRYIQIVEDVKALETRITEALSQATENANRMNQVPMSSSEDKDDDYDENDDNYNGDDSESISTTHQQENIISATNVSSETEIQSRQITSHNEFSTSTSSCTEVTSTKSIEVVTLKSSTISSTSVVQAQALESYDDSIASPDEVDNKSSGDYEVEHDNPLEMFDNKMNELQKWLMNRRNYNMKLNQIMDIKTLEDTLEDIDASLSRGNEIFKDLTTAYEHSRSEDPGIVDEKYDRLEGEFSGFNRDISSTISLGRYILPKSIQLKENASKGAKVLEDSFALEMYSSKNKDDMEKNIRMLKASAIELNEVCKEIESNDLDNIETDEHFITTVIDSVNVPAYGVLSQCQLRHRKLEELIEEYEKDLRSLDSTETIESNEEETESYKSDIDEDEMDENLEEDVEEQDEGIEDDNDDMSSENIPDLQQTKVKITYDKCRVLCYNVLQPRYTRL